MKTKPASHPLREFWHGLTCFSRRRVRDLRRMFWWRRLQKISALTPPNPTNTREQTTRFIILFGGRTGSSYLTELLNSHPDITCLRELLASKELSTAEAQKRFLHRRFVVNTTDDSAILGMKTKLRDVCAPDEFFTFLHQHHFRIIHMQRRNLLKVVISTIVSEKLWKEYGVWNINESSKRLPPFYLPVRYFLRIVTHLERLHADLVFFISKAKLPVHEVFYEDLLLNKEQTLERLYAFLGATPQKTHSKLVKATPDDLSRVLLNFPQLQAESAKLDKEAMLTEVLIPPTEPPPRNDLRSTSDAPTASVAILVRNGGVLFHSLLHALCHQQCEHPFEVVVLDSGSTDSTLELAQRYKARVVHYHGSFFHFGAARDQLVTHCRGKHIVFISADALPVTADWLATMLAPLISDEADIVQGNEPANYKTFFWERVNRFYTLRPLQRFSQSAGSIALSTVCLACPKAIAEQLSFSPSGSCEDKLFQLRAVKKNLRIHFQRPARVVHSHHYSLRPLIQRCKEEGQGLHFMEQEYLLRDAVLDMLSPRQYGYLIFGLVSLQIRSFAELSFPIVRPLATWYYAKRFKGEY